jgi:Putative protein-S-isoprenylcysteine methyltransferase
MQKYLALASIILMILMVITRILMLKRQGIKAVKFGEIDKKDFIIPPFMLFYLYLIVANAFELPTISEQEIFYNGIVAWLGVLLCLAGLVFISWSLISFQKSFRVGIDTEHSGGLITTGIFAFSRNPIYVAFGLTLIGQFLVFPSWILLLYYIAGVWLFHRQVLREEEFLKQQFGQEYFEYCKRVRRYL